MTLSTVKEEFLRKFFARQKEISIKSLKKTSTLAKANMKGIIWSGLESPFTKNTFEEVLEEIKEEILKKDDEDHGE